MHFRKRRRLQEGSQRGLLDSKFYGHRQESIQSEESESGIAPKSRRETKKKPIKKKRTQKSSPELRDLVRVFLGFSPEVRCELSAVFFLLSAFGAPNQKPPSGPQPQYQKTFRTHGCTIFVRYWAVSP